MVEGIPNLGTLKCILYRHLSLSICIYFTLYFSFNFEMFIVNNNKALFV